MMTEQDSQLTTLTERIDIAPTGTISGDVKGELTLEKTIADTFDGYFDRYVVFANDPNPNYELHLPMRSRFDTEVDIVLPRSEVSEQQLDELKKYIRYAFIEGTLAIDPSVLQSNEKVTIDEICDAYATDSIIRAQVRYDTVNLLQGTTYYPGHITEETSNGDVEESASFFDQVKHYGAVVLRAITLHSGEVNLPERK
jgi:hypothetical protein